MNESYTIISKLLDASPLLPANAKRLLAHLEDHRNKTTGLCNPQHPTLAKELAVSVDTIDRMVAKLKSIGMIQVRKGQRGNSFVIAPRADWSKILLPQNRGAETVSATAKPRSTLPQNRGAGASYPYMNFSLKEPIGFPSKAKALNALPPRKSAQSEILEAYYREERRKAGSI